MFDLGIWWPRPLTLTLGFRENVYGSQRAFASDHQNNIYSNNIMSIRNELVRRLLSGITMSELRNLVKLREQDSRPIPAPRRRTPIPAPRRNVRQLKQYFENNPVPTYRPISAPRTKKQQRPVPTPRTRINEKRKALKGFTQSFEISLKSNKHALVQLQNTRLAISRLFGTLLQRTKGLKFVEALKVTFVKRKDYKNIYKPAYFNSRAQIVITPMILYQVYNYHSSNF